MTDDNGGGLRTVAWKELFPWLNIFRVFRLSISLPALLFGAAGVLLTVTGWWLLGNAFAPDARLAPSAECPWKAVTDIVPNRPGLSGVPKQNDISKLENGGWHPTEPVIAPWQLLNQAAWTGLSDTGLPVATLAYVVFCGLWSVAVWALFGAAISRIAAVQLAAGERLGIAAALRYALRKWPSYCAAPLLPIGGVALATIPICLLGLLLRANVGVLLAGLIWPVVLALGFLMTLLLLGTLFGWPLMWGTISTEGTDSFDALSRSYAYLFQRPLHYIFYTLVAAAIGGLGWLLVQNFAAGVVWMGYWGAGWGSGNAQAHAVMGDGGATLEGLGYGGAWLIHFWTGCVKLLAVGFLFSYFWTASTAVYLLLRRDVDATEMDEVFLDADAGEPAKTLPPIKADANGAPVVNDEPDTASDIPPTE